MTEVTLETELEGAITAQRAGAIAEAERIYRNVLHRDAHQPVANHNLAVLLIQRGAANDSLRLFDAARRADPGEAQYWLSQARALLTADRPEEAFALLQRGLAEGFSEPQFDALLEQLATRLPDKPDVLFAAALASQRAGRTGEAIVGYRKVISIDPSHLGALVNLGTALATQEQFDDAIEALSAAAGWAETPAPIMERLGDTFAAKGDADAAIVAYRDALSIDPALADAHFNLGALLAEAGDVAQSFEHFMARASLVHAREDQELPPSASPHKVKHDREQSAYLADRLGQVRAPSCHIADGTRVAGPAVNPASVPVDLTERWRTAWPSMVVVDNFLTAPALDRLRRYCAESTVWHRVYDAGYIGATPQDGFACPLLAQIAEEIALYYRAIIGHHRFRYLGAFKYDSVLSKGTNTHADFSAVNVNFYITPDTANRDPKSGGMQIWDVAIPDAATLRLLNSNEAAMQQFLSDAGARSITVPHRTNRAVLFRSNLIHKTDRCDFREGYLNKRINVSLLYGEFGEIADHREEV